MAQKFKKPPICEVCGKGTADSFSHFEDESLGCQWKFVCMCSSKSEGYYTRIDDFFDSPGSTIDWLAHLHEKPQTNWGDFMDMILRFRKATDSFNML